MGVSAKSKAYSYCQVCLTVVLLSCIQVNDVHVFQCLTFNDTQRESATEMLLDQKAAEEEEKGAKRKKS